MSAAKILLPLSLALGALPVVASTETTATPTPAAAAATAPIQYKFIAQTIPSPYGSGVVGVVSYAAVTASGDMGATKTVVTIPSAVGKFTQAKRADLVAGRLQGSDKTLFTSLALKKEADGQFALVAPSQAVIITADPDSAALYEGHNASPVVIREYAQFLKKQLVTTLTGLFGIRDAKFDYDLGPDEKHDRAVLYREQADGAFGDDKGRAETLYAQAIKVDPAYAMPYVALCSLYSQEGRDADAKKVLALAETNNLDLTASIQSLKTDTTPGQGDQEKLIGYITRMKNNG